MLLFLPFALFGLLLLFRLLVTASVHALPLGCGLAAALAAAGAGWPAPIALAPGIGVFLLLEAALAFAGARWRLRSCHWPVATLLVVPAAIAGYSVGALAAAWLGFGGTLLAGATALIAAASAGRSLGVHNGCPAAERAGSRGAIPPLSGRTCPNPRPRRSRSGDARCAAPCRLRAVRTDAPRPPCNGLMTESGCASAARGRNGGRALFSPAGPSRVRHSSRDKKARVRRPPASLRAFGCGRGGSGHVPSHRGRDGHGLED